MAGDSNNPFRRKGPSVPAVSVPSFPSAASPARGHHPFDQPFEQPLDSVSSAASVSTPASSSELFKRQLQSLPKSAQAPPSTTFQKPKPVKKVRVQSPPPSSPESAHDADFESRFPADPDGPSAGFGLHHRPRSDSESDGSDSTEDDPFAGGDSTAPSERHVEHARKDQAVGGAAATTVSPGGKAPLDVDAFRRLLMTGQSGAATNSHGQHQTQQQPPHHQADAASITDASSVSRQSISDERSSSGNPSAETPRTSHEISEPEGEDEQHGLISSYPTQQPRTTLRKKPPPPASRHGKLIKAETVAAGSNGGGHPRQDEGVLSSPTASLTDLNKPLPPAPRPNGDDFRESVFDREAAGKIPEVDVDPDAPDAEIPAPRPPTPPNASHSTTLSVPAPQPQLQESPISRFSTSASRKPAPPPRRQAHGRSDSRATITSNASLTSPTLATHQPFSPSREARVDEAGGQGHERRTSTESVRSRSSSMRGPGVTPPAPPPPRRPSTINPPTRQSSTYGSGPTASPGGLSGIPSPAGSPGVAATGGHDDEHGPKPSVTPSPVGASTKTNNTPSPGSLSKRPAAMAPPPPPPPARQHSVRSSVSRPASIKSIDSVSRRGEPREGGPTSGSAPPPPPPRPRGRGGNRTSGGSPADSNKPNSNPEESRGSSTPSDGVEAAAGGAENILADLDALQREVEALRGQMAGKP